MRHLLLSLVAWVLLVAGVQAQQPAAAVVRLTSHGASGTVIATEQGRSLILSAAHPWEGAQRNRAIVFDAPSPQSGPSVSGTHPRVVKIDERADLALVEVGVGPLPYAMGVSTGTAGGAQRCRSVGYDRMTYPAVNVPVTIIGTDASHIYTRERPVEGRSGGPLVCDGQLVGVVVGYETNPGGRGIYVSLKAIRSFLAGAVGAPQGFTPPPAAPPGSPLTSLPGIHEERSFELRPIPYTSPLCPDGRCPILGR